MLIFKGKPENGTVQPTGSTRLKNIQGDVPKVFLTWTFINPTEREYLLIVQVDILAKVLYFQELLKKSDFDWTPPAKEHVFLHRISVRVLLA